MQIATQGKSEARISDFYAVAGNQPEPGLDEDGEPLGAAAFLKLLNDE